MENYSPDYPDFKDKLNSFKFERNKPESRRLLYIKDAEKLPTKKLFRFLLILLPFALILAYITIPKDGYDVYKLETGQISNENIKSPFDIEIEDKITTERKRLEKLETVPPVFDYDPAIAKRKNDFLASFIRFLDSYMQILIDENKSNGTIAVPDSNFEELKETLKKEYQLEFTVNELKSFLKIAENDQIGDLGLFFKNEIIDSIYDKKVIRDRNELNAHIRTGIILKNISTKQEIKLTAFNDITDLESSFDTIRTKVDIFLLHIRQPLRDPINKIINFVLEPNITLNRSESEARKSEIIESIPKVFFSKKKGEKIIGEGERITESHILILEEINKRIALQRVTYSYYMYVFIYCAVIAVIFFFILLLFHPWHALSSYYNYIMVLVLFILNIFIINILWHFYMLLSAAFEREPFIVNEHYIYALPYAFGVLMLSVLLNSKTAFTFGVFQLLFYIFLLRLEGLQIIYVFIGISSASIMRYVLEKKNFYIKSVLIIVLLQSFSAVLNTLMTEYYNFSEIGFRILLVIISGLSVYILINTLVPLFEWLFKLSTDMKLLELLDFNHPLLDKLMFIAGGTLHHSIAVANLSEVAARNTGCNSILCRVASYYHDIGKINKAEYFIENLTGRENKHDKLKPSMSALILISHVKSGYELGKKYRLPAPILEVIREHHGNSLIRYFYEKALREQPEGKNGEVPEDNFRYPGPRPKTKESAIILLADRVEATSRVLVNPSSSKIRSMIENIVKSALLDGDLDESNLSLNEISDIIESFCKVLYGAFHKRIDYPNQPVSYKI